MTPDDQKSTEHDVYTLLEEGGGRSLEDQLVLLSEITQSFAFSLDIDETLANALQKFMQYLDAEASSVFLLENGGAELVCRECAGPVDILGLRLPSEKGIVGKAVTEKTCQMVRDVSKDSSFAQQVDEETGFVTRSILCTPLMIRDDCIGALEVINKRGGNGLFDERDKHLITVLAAAAALAIHNARMADKMVVQERMQRELEMGQELQLSVLPQDFPAFPEHGEFNIHASMKAAREVGGDFYDYFFIDDDHLCICVGDVSGKGVPAALFMMISKALIKSRASDDLSTANILTHVNGSVAADNETMMFVTVFMAILNIRSGEMVYTNAGHNPPYLKRTNGNLERMDQRHGPAVGPVEGVEYNESQDTLYKGDTIVLYTDGVTEAMDPGHRLYEEARLVELLESLSDSEPEEVIEATLVDIKRFAAGAEQSDDITLLALRFHNTPGIDSGARFSFTMRNQLAEVEKVLLAFEEFSDKKRIPESVRHDVKLAFDELLNNTISYGYPDGGDHEVSISIELNSDDMTITIIDDGIEFDPLAREAPDVRASMEDRGIGGLGIHLVRNLMDKVSYIREEGQNRLTMKKSLEQ